MCSRFLLIAKLLLIALVPAAETEEAGLGRKVRSGARWSMVNTLVLRVANFTVGVVLARTVFGPQADYLKIGFWRANS